MKISNGNIWEFILAIFFLMLGFNIDDNFTSILVIAISILVIVHCLYLWIKQKMIIKREHNKLIKQEDAVHKNINEKIKSKKVLTTILITSLTFNLVLLISTLFFYNKNYNNLKQKNSISKDVDYCKSLLKEINFYSSPKWEKVWDISSARYVNTYEIDYFINQADFENIEKCYEKLNIKINK